MQVILKRYKKSYSVGFVYSEQLTLEQLKALGYTIETAPSEIEALVQYDKYWDDDILEVQIEAVTLWNGTTELEVTKLITNTSELEREIADQIYGDALEDRVSSLSDYYYDRFKDGE